MSLHNYSDPPSIFEKLKDLGAKLDRIMPRLNADLSKPASGCKDYSEDVKVIQKIRDLYNDVEEATETSKSLLTAQQKSNLEIKSQLQSVTTRLGKVEDNIFATMEYLKTYGMEIEIENDDVSVPQKNPIEESESSDGTVPASAQKQQRTPDLTNFGLSSETVDLLYSYRKGAVNEVKSERSIYTCKSVVGNMMDIPKMEPLWDSTPQPHSTTGGIRRPTPETPELTNFLLLERQEESCLQLWNKSAMPLSYQKSVHDFRTPEMIQNMDPNLPQQSGTVLRKEANPETYQIESVTRQILTPDSPELTSTFHPMINSNFTSVKKTVSDQACAVLPKFQLDAPLPKTPELSMKYDFL